MSNIVYQRVRICFSQRSRLLIVEGWSSMPSWHSYGHCIDARKEMQRRELLQHFDVCLSRLLIIAPLALSFRLRFDNQVRRRRKSFTSCPMTHQRRVESYLKNDLQFWFSALSLHHGFCEWFFLRRSRLIACTVHWLASFCEIADHGVQLSRMHNQRFALNGIILDGFAAMRR